ncbi:hypothetical protein [Brucella rhizosphaerae]|uniref:hypothetical protein n=1 Tax=Brucella rhizosphaerae TaxID=571254 RepID=UPI0004664B0E|nr:hypothetical protein [Brucella rhizosphaerae]
MRDLANNIGVFSALAPAVQTANATGTVIDRKGFEKVTYIVNTGAIAADGDFTFKVQDSDTITPADFADVDPKWIIGEAPDTLEATSAYKLGYWGHKRYTRLVLTKAGGTSIAAGAVAVLAGAHARPVGA